MVDKLRGQRSLFGEILDWMLAPLLLLWPMSVGLTWVVAQEIAHRPYDRALGEMARALAQQMQVVQEAQAARGPNGAQGTPAPPSRSLRFALTAGAAELLRADEADTIYYQAGTAPSPCRSRTSARRPIRSATATT